MDDTEKWRREKKFNSILRHKKNGKLIAGVSFSVDRQL